MRIRSLTLFAFLALAVPVRAADEKTAPTLVIRLKSIDGLTEDALYLAEAAGKGKEAKELNNILKNLGGLKGIDSTKPIGLYGRLAAKIEESDYALMVPISNEKDFLALLEGVGATIGIKFEKGPDDVYKIDLPKVPVPGYFRFANGYVYFTVRDAKLLAKDRLLTPAAVLPPGKTGMLEVALALDQVPDAFKEVIVAQTALRLSEAKGDKKGDETDAQYKFRIAVVDELANQIKAIVNDGKDMTLTLDVDRKNADVVASARFTAKPGSKLATSLAEVGQEKSIMANLGAADSALSGRFFAAMPKELRKPYDAFLDDLMKQAMAKAPDENARKLLDQIIKAAVPTLKGAELDSGFDLRGPAANGRYNLIAGTAVKEGAEIEQAVRALHAAIPGEIQNLIKLDAEKASGVNIHRFSPPAEVLDPNIKRVFGDGPVYLAIRKDAMLLAIGDKALDNLKDVLAREPRAGKLLQVELSVARLVPLDKKEDAIAVAKKVFGNDTDADKVRLTLEGGKALELRLSAKAKLLEFGLQLDEMRKKGEK